MKIKLTILLICLCFTSIAQSVSTYDFVEILNNNRDEAIFYYENNWKALRERAIEKEYIESYQFLESKNEEGASFDIILITTYTDKKQYDSRELNFTELIEAKGELKLLNQKQPSDFRKTLFYKEEVIKLAEGGL